MELKFHEVRSLIYAIILDYFCVLIVKILVLIVQSTRHRKVIKNVFGHNVERPSS